MFQTLAKTPKQEYHRCTLGYNVGGDPRWVITWEVIDGSVGIKRRLTARGFKDKFQDLDTYAGATSRSGQRLANAVAAENVEFILFSFDVSQAFAKGMAFEEFSAFSGQDIGNEEFDVPKADVVCLRELLDFKDFGPVKETLTMQKSLYGLKGAPRAWRKKLHQVFVDWVSCRQLYAEFEFYCVHNGNARSHGDPYERGIGAC